VVAGGGPHSRHDSSYNAEAVANAAGSGPRAALASAGSQGMKNAGRTSQSGPRSKSGNQQSASNNANWTMNQYLLNRQFQQQASMQNQKRVTATQPSALMLDFFSIL